MKTAHTKLRAKSREQANRDRNRGDVYRWLLAHQAAISKAFLKKGIVWETIVETMLEEGVVGRDGMPPNTNSAPKVWARVCKDVVARPAPKSAGPARARSTTSWAPPEGNLSSRAASRAGSRTRAEPTQPGAPASRPEATETGLSEIVRQKIERVRQEQAAMDRPPVWSKSKGR